MSGRDSGQPLDPELLAGYLEGRLSDTQRSSVEERLADDPVAFSVLVHSVRAEAELTGAEPPDAEEAEPEPEPAPAAPPPNQTVNTAHVEERLSRSRRFVPKLSPSLLQTAGKLVAGAAVVALLLWLGRVLPDLISGMHLPKLSTRGASAPSAADPNSPEPADAEHRPTGAEVRSDERKRGAEQLQRGNPAGAVRTLGFAEAGAASDPTLQVQRAAAYAAQGARGSADSWARALQASERALVAQPASPDALYQRCAALDALGALESAREACREAASSGTGQPWMADAERRANALARAFQPTGEPARSQADAVRARALVAQAEQQDEASLRPEALALVHSALELCRGIDDPGARTSVEAAAARAWMARGQFAAAVALLESLLPTPAPHEAEPEAWTRRLDLAEAYLGVDRPDRARATLDDVEPRIRGGEPSGGGSGLPARAMALQAQVALAAREPDRAAALATDALAKASPRDHGTRAQARVVRSRAQAAKGALRPAAAELRSAAADLRRKRPGAAQRASLNRNIRRASQEIALGLIRGHEPALALLAIQAATAAQLDRSADERPLTVTAPAGAVILGLARVGTRAGSWLIVGDQVTFADASVADVETALAQAAIAAGQGRLAPAVAAIDVLADTLFGPFRAALAVAPGVVVVADPWALALPLPAIVAHARQNAVGSAALVVPLLSDVPAVLQARATVPSVLTPARESPNPIADPPAKPARGAVVRLDDGDVGAEDDEGAGVAAAAAPKLAEGARAVVTTAWSLDEGPSAFVFAHYSDALSRGLSPAEAAADTRAWADASGDPTLALAALSLVVVE